MCSGALGEIRNAKPSRSATRMRASIRIRAARALVVVVLISILAPTESLATEVSELSKKANLQFLQTAFAQWTHLTSKNAGKAPTTLMLGQSGYVGLHELIRGQSEISVDNIRFKLGERIAAGDLKELGTGIYHLTHDAGRSSTPAIDPLEVIRTRHGYLIADGHHDFYLALFTGAETVAVKVLHDFSQMNDRELWKSLKSKQLVYLNESVDQLVRRMPRVEDVRDNPNRYLASLLAIKASSARSSDGSVLVSAIKGHAEGIWIKQSGAIPFAEFYIAAALSEAGIEYDARWKNSVPHEIVERSRNALLRAQKHSQKHAMLKLILSIDSAEKAKVLRADPTALAKAIDSFEAVTRPNCRAVFL